VIVVAATLYDWLKFLHIVAAMVWVGGTVALSALATYIVRSGEREAIARFVGSLRFVGPLTLAPATLAVVGLGIWLVVDSDAWDFGQTWIWLALALFAAAFLVGAAFQSRAAIGAQRAAAAGNDGEAARQLRRWSWGSRVILVLLVLATWDMVFKPGL
jgi:uncharacterized membrane protein